MKRKRYSEGQVAFALRHAEGGTALEEICRKLGGVRADLLQVEEAVRWVEEENAKLKRLVADLTLDKTMLQDVLRRKW